MSFTIKFDYRFDSNGFFTDPTRRATLEAAAAEWEAIIQDEFDDIPVEASFSINNPSVDNQREDIVLTEAIDDVLIFVGARNGLTNAVARAGPSGFDLQGDIYTQRISSDFRNNGPVTDFEPWAGIVYFDTTRNWHFDLTQPGAGDLDLFSVALHEIGHVLGIGTSGAFETLITGGGTTGQPPVFNGVNSTALNSGSGVPLDPEEGHVEEGFNGDTVVLDPSGANAPREMLSEFDKAILADIGFQVTGYTAQGSQPALATNGAERISGTDQADNIDALGGEDTVFGNKGDDTLNGNGDNDTLYGDEGNDLLNGGGGNDQLQGGIDNDVLNGNAGEDLLFGDDGHDTLNGGANDDQLQGNGGHDLINGDAGADDLFGQNGNDTLNGGGDNDNIQGGEGTDLLTGDDGLDTLFGQDGNDTLNGGKGDDRLLGGNNDDLLRGGEGNDALFGQNGTDTFQFAAGSGQDTVNDFDPATEMIQLLDSGFSSVAQALSAISKPFTNVSRILLPDGSTLDVFHASQSGTPLDQTNVSLASALPNNPAGGAVTIDGTAQEGATLTANTTQVMDLDGIGPFSIDWLRDGQSTGQTGTTYTLAAADIGGAISVRVAFTDQRGFSETLTSAATSAVQNVNDTPQGNVTISGDLVAGSTLTADASAITDADGLGPLTITWLRDGANSGLTGQTYTLVAADVGAAISARVSYTDQQGTDEAVTSAATAAISNFAQVLNGDAGNNLLSGGAGNDLLSGGPGDDTLTGGGGADVFDINPQEDADLITDFVTGQDKLDLSDFVRADVLRTFVNAPTTGPFILNFDDGSSLNVQAPGGGRASLTLADLILAPGDLPATGKPIIEGLFEEGVTLSVNTGSVNDVDGFDRALGTYTWYRNGNMVSTGTDDFYITGQADVGSTITVEYLFTDFTGNAETVTSDPTPTIANINDNATGFPPLNGSAFVGTQLQLDLSVIQDADGITQIANSVAYQWLRDGTDIAGATNATYTPVVADVGSVVSARITFTDDLGGSETLFSIGSFATAQGTVQNGSLQDDTLIGTIGDDSVNGDLGTDTFQVIGSQSAFTLTLSASSTTLTDRKAVADGGQGQDFLSSIELLDFTTEIPLFGAGPMNLDIFDGPTGLSATDFAQITELYIAYFNRAPDALGLYYWASQFADGFSVPDMAQNFFLQAETLNTYSAVLDGSGNLSDIAAFVTAVYGNVLGRAPDAPGFNYWSGELANNPNITPDVFILSIINGAKFPSNPTAQTAVDQAYLSNKTDVGVYYSAIRGLSDIQGSKTAMAQFDGSDPSIIAAKAEIDAQYTNALDADTGQFLFQLVGVIDDPFIAL